MRECKKPLETMCQKLSYTAPRASVRDESWHLEAHKEKCLQARWEVFVVWKQRKPNLRPHYRTERWRDKRL